MRDSIHKTIVFGYNAGQLINQIQTEYAKASSATVAYHRIDDTSAIANVAPDGRGFYPDFVIGVEGRKTEEGVLLADPKLNYQRDDEAPKVLAEHQVYGRVLILFREGGTRWMTVGYDDKSKKPCLAREFRLSDVAGF